MGRTQKHDHEWHPISHDMAGDPQVFACSYSWVEQDDKKRWRVRQCIATETQQQRDERALTAQRSEVRRQNKAAREAARGFDL